ncbi:MAG: WG repeat-containing protein [Treponema sp.]|nr:WG repeat-containing protein [Treponema sp.]
MVKRTFLFSLLSALFTLSVYTEIFPFRYNGKYGLLNQNLDSIIPAEYDSITPEFNNKYFIASKNQNNTIETEIYSKEGKCLYKTTGIVRHIWNDYFSLFTEKGETLFNLHTDAKICAYQFTPSSEAKIPCRKDVYRQYINEEGIVIFPELAFRRSYGFYEGHSVNLNTDWEYEIIDNDGKYIFGHNLLDAGQHYSEGLLYARDKKGNCGFVDYNGNFKIKIQLKKQNEDTVIATSFYKGRAIVNTTEHGICLIDSNGKILKEKLQFAWFYDFCEDFAIITNKDGTYNFMTLEGNLLSDKNFDEVKNFCNGYAIISLNGKDGLIDKKGKIIYKE